MTYNISFGTLLIGGQNDATKTEARTTINRLCQDDKEVAKNLGNFCNMVDQETGEDLFILRASNSRGVGAFDLYHSSPYPANTTDDKVIDKTREGRVFRKLVNLNGSGGHKNDFINSLTEAFKESLNSSSYLITKIISKYNSRNKETGITIQNSDGKFVNLKRAVAWDNNKEIINEFDTMLENISKVLQDKHLKAKLTAVRSNWNKENGVILTLKSEALPQNSCRILIKDEASPEERLEEFKNLYSDTMYYLSDLEEPLPSSSFTHLNYDDKTDMLELNAIFDKYC